MNDMQSNWKNLVLKNEKKIKKAMTKMYWDALMNKHLRFVLNMDKSGYLWVLQDIAGGNSFSSFVHNGTAIEIVSYCHQYFDCNAPMEQHAYKETQLDNDFDAFVECLDRSYQNSNDNY